ncbi:MAG: polysaccharide deacetylase family protein [Solirubrobacterales bacterium]|nr:polysaccharide deacetylase family protein [Solirubrobacterales bacterium]MBV9166958.1 polysaccharide deacetylase family protein [Solirubrobacterales bacterium]
MRTATCLRSALAVLLGASVLAGCGGASARPPRRARAGCHAGCSAPGAARTTITGKATGKPGTAAVPVLMYHVINPPIPAAPYPGLYVPKAQFAAQMQALEAAGWHAVTMDQLLAYWTRGVPLPPGKPIVLTFDNGYVSQYTNALPVLRRLGWPGVENIQLTGLPPAQGGLSEAQVRSLIRAGWELDTQGMSHADLITLGPAALHYQIATARQILRRRFRVPVDWFAYPSGHYDATVIAALKAAGFVGSETVVPGWASPGEDRFRLPRLRVLGGTSPRALLAQITSARGAAPPPLSYP